MHKTVVEHTRKHKDKRNQWLIARVQLLPRDPNLELEFEPPDEWHRGEAEVWYCHWLPKRQAASSL